MRRSLVALFGTAVLLGVTFMLIAGHKASNSHMWSLNFKWENTTASVVADGPTMSPTPAPSPAPPSVVPRNATNTSSNNARVPGPSEPSPTSSETSVVAGIGAELHAWPDEALRADSPEWPEYYVDKPGFVDVSKANSGQRGQCGGTSGEYKSLQRRAAGITIGHFDTKKQWPLEKFSPATREVTTTWTDVSKGKDKSIKKVKQLLSLVYDEKNYTKQNFARQYLNEMGLCLNKEEFDSSRTVYHLPIWLRVYQRTNPTKKVLDSLRKVDNINETILFVSIDGAHRDVLDLILTIDFVTVRIFWHDAQWEFKHFNPKNADTLTGKINAHYAYGLRLIFDVFGYPYVITLEDDIEPGPDIYLFHMAWHKYTFYDRFFAVHSIVHGPFVDCHSIANILLNKGECRVSDTEKVMLEKWYGGWGAGLPRSVFPELMPHVWDKVVYDGALALLASKGNRVSITPCSPRAKWIPNTGVHGGGQNQRWDHPLPMVHSHLSDTHLVRAAGQANSAGLGAGGPRPIRERKYARPKHALFEVLNAASGDATEELGPSLLAAVAPAPGSPLGPNEVPADLVEALGFDARHRLVRVNVDTSGAPSGVPYPPVLM